MEQAVRERIERYAESCRAEQLALLKTLGAIPAPTRQEGARAAFVRDWLLAQGAPEVTIDPAGNVVCRLACGSSAGWVAFAAHTDIVFPDQTPLPLREENGRLYAPGIGDDTANLVNLLLAARYLFQNNVPLRTGVLIVANACEEGLGNLDGTRALFDAWGDRIRGFYSFDLYTPLCCRTAVGSRRYRVACTAAGGHSYGDFGKPSAVRLLCGLVDELYRVTPPARAKTTYNVGRIEGGTTVNAIAQTASLLYEFRSADAACLAEMERAFRLALSHWQGRGGAFTAELLGVRPCSGAVDAAALRAFTAAGAEAIQTFAGRPPAYTPASTDSNIPLSRGIPANTIGTVTGGGAHTREEWVALSSLPDGIKIVLALLLRCAAPPAA